MCSSDNQLLLFTAQLHPTRASKAQSQAAGKLEERSEGEGPHQLSQQRKGCLFFSGPAGLSLQEEGEFWGQKPTKNGSHWAPGDSDAQILFHLLSLSLLQCLVRACPTFVILLVCSSHQPGGQGHPWADSSALSNLGSGAAFGKLPRCQQGEGCTSCTAF